MDAAASTPGPVTFLFTDIEGSTALLRRLGAREYGRVLGRHDRIVRDAVESHGGSVVDTQGDALFAAFPDAAGAVRAAVEAQSGLGQAGDEPLRVRMGAHTGRPEVAGGRYLGLDVHLAARICAAAHGGQLVVSRDITESLGAGEELAVRALGEHRLKDFDAPMGLYQIDPSGADREFPALRTGASIGDAGGFAGREDELAEAASAAIARSARRSERRRLLTVFAVIAAITVAVAVVLATRPHPIRVVGDSVAVIDAKSAKVTADIPVGPAPTSIVSGAGAVWALDTANDTLWRIDPSTHRAQSQGVGLGSRPTDLAVSGNEVWVVNGFARTASVLSATADETPIQTVPLHGSLGLLGVGDAYAATGPGAMWISNGGSAGVSQYKLPSNKFVKTIPGASGRIAVGAGAVWLVVSYTFGGATGSVDRIDPQSGRVVKQIRVGEADAIGADVAGVWVADAATNTVRGIDPKTNSVTQPIHVAGGADSIAVGDGYVWVAGSGGVISRINPHTHQVDQIPLDAGRPVSLTVYRGALYVGLAKALPPNVTGGGLRVTIPPTSIDSVDPAFAFFANTWQILAATDLNLVRYPDAPAPAGIHVVPDAAVAMPRISNHGHKYTFVVRRGYRFSAPSNQPVTAADFRTAIERDLRIPVKESTPASFARVIAGANAFIARKTKHPSGIKVHGQTISITTTQDPGALLSELALPPFAAVPPNTPIGDGQTPIPSAGPYYVRSYDRNHLVVLAKNRHYPGPRPSNLREITYRERPDASWQAVTAGRADYSIDPTRPIPAGLIARYGPQSPDAHAGHQRLFVNPTPSVAWLALNTHRRLFRTVAARQAINYAIDRPALTATFGPDGAIPTDQYLPPSMPSYPGSGHIYPLGRPKIARARQLLRQAGIHTPVTASVYNCNDTPICVSTSRILTRDLRPLGIALRIHSFPRTTQFNLDKAPGTPFDIALEGFIYPTNDPAFFLKFTNFGYLNTGPYTAAINQATNRLRGPRYNAAFRRIDLELARNYAPLAAYAITNHLDYFSARVGCQTYQPYYGIDLTRLCLH